MANGSARRRRDLTRGALEAGAQNSKENLQFRAHKPSKVDVGAQQSFDSAKDPETQVIAQVKTYL